MYADSVSPQMKHAIEVTERRREIQDRYNKEHGITPASVKKSVRPAVKATEAAEEADLYMTDRKPSEMTKKELQDYVKKLESEMRAAASALQFEQAAHLRDLLFELKVKL